jgi:hypothetical protein
VGPGRLQSGVRVTADEFAAASGLSVEEAELILRRRQAASEPADARVNRARSILALAQKRVGVQPVAVDGASLEKVYDPVADVGLSEFYKGKDGAVPVEKSRKLDHPGWDDDEYNQGGGE